MRFFQYPLDDLIIYMDKSLTEKLSELTFLKGNLEGYFWFGFTGGVSGLVFSR